VCNYVGVDLRLCAGGAGVRRGCKVQYTDGGAECVIMRKRPHLIFAKDGVTPLAFSTAAMHGPVVVPGTFAHNRTSFTLVQALDQKERVSRGPPR
jgi:hypothetical protein